MRTISFAAISVSVTLSAMTMIHAAPEGGNEAAARAVLDYIRAQHLDDRWQSDPTPLDSAELRTTYPGLRFFFTFKPTPLPPGAPLPDALARYEQARDDFRRNSLRLTVAVDAAGKAWPMTTAADSNHGMQPVRTDAEAKVAAAAILSLMGDDHVRPGAISAQDVVVVSGGDGWTCNVDQKPRGVRGQVKFDRDGKCIAVSKQLNYTPPTPP